MFKMHDPVIMPGNTVGHICELKETPKGPRVVVEYTSQAEFAPALLQHADASALERNRSLAAELEQANATVRSLQETIERNAKNPPIPPSKVKEILRSDPARARAGRSRPKSRKR